MKKLSNKQFKQFKKLCLEFQKKFHLNEYMLYFSFEPLTESYALTRTNQHGKVAEIVLSSELTEENFKDLNLKETVKHEMIHLILAELTEKGYQRFTTKDELYSTEEGVVNKLCRLIT